MHYRGVDHRITGLDKQFVVTTEATATAQLGKRPLNNPVSRQEFKAFGGGVPFDDFQFNPHAFEQLGNKVDAPINAVRLTSPQICTNQSESAAKLGGGGCCAAAPSAANSAGVRYPRLLWGRC